jgi:23S rRNA pseudouridine1911/1915/1917 synthase
MSRVIAARTDFVVLEETADWLVVDKPAPLIVHPTSKKKEPTLLCGLKAMLAARGEESGMLSFINRLDRETSGLVLVARNAGAARVFGKAMMRRQIGKAYRAIVRGWPDWEELRVDGPILRRGEIEEEARVWVRQMVHPDGKPCVTNLRVERRIERPEGRFTLLQVTTETGRMHQIRVHCAHAGHPIVGDKIYGGNEECYLKYMESGWTAELRDELLMERQALHASRLNVDWNGERRDWESPLPDEMTAFLG